MDSELDVRKVFKDLMAYFDEQKKYELDRIQWMAEGARRFYDGIRREAERLQSTGEAKPEQPQSTTGDVVGPGAAS